MWRVIAVLGGLGAACAWAIATLCSSRSSRMVDPAIVVAWVMLVGLLIAGPIALAEGVPAHRPASAWIWLVLAGAGNVAGLVCTYGGLRLGQVALVAPLVSAEGAIAAVIALLAGESLGADVVATLALLAVGVALASVPDRAAHPDTQPEHHTAALAFAVGAAVLFGGSLYATGRAGAMLPSAWVVLSARLIGAVVLAIPFALAGRLRMSRRLAPLVIASGVGEVVGFFAFTAGARHGIAVAAVLSSQWATIAAVAAYVLFRERLGRLQLIGVVIVVAGVALLSALRV
jgi:drug/metabolite transporter (DMT)-like permease